MGLYDFSFYDLIKRNAITYNNRPCWYEVDDGRKITFGDYKREVDLLACGLSQAGIEKGDRIGVIGKNSLEFFLIYGAAAFLGAIVLPINWRLSGDEISFNLGDCAPKIVFSDEEFQATLEDKRDELPSVSCYYNLNSDSGTFTKFSSLMTSQGCKSDMRSGREITPADVESTDGFVIIHTAAVAGRPRGALLSHGNILCADLHFKCYMDLSSEDIHLNLLPLFHVGGLFLATSTFHGGGLNINVSKFDAKQAAKLIEDNRVTLFFDFPPILDSILEAAEEENYSVDSLKAIVGLGTREGIEKFQQLTGGNYFVMYGQTETSCLTTIGKYNDCPGSAGKTVMLADVQLVDDHDIPVKAGEVGEITIKGPMVFKGYWNLAEDNEYTFRGDRHHTGDLGRFDDDGFLFYAGRKAEKELIKPGGENVYPAEVEKVILQHPDIAQTVVIGVPDPKWKEGIKAVCLLEPGKSMDTQDLINFVGDRIARFKKPQYVEFVKKIPTGEDGSPDRAAVKSLYGQV